MKNNKVTKKQCLEALRYFHAYGFIDELTTDKKYYVQILMNKVAQEINVRLE